MTAFKNTAGFQHIQRWMTEKGIQPFSFQERTWKRYSNGHSGMVIAPTGFGKTYSIFLAVVIDYLNHPKKYKKGLKLLWISPLRALAKDLRRVMQEAIDELGLNWVAGVRNGDTPQKERQKQARSMPDILIITPESLHLLFSMKRNTRFFKSLHCIAVDEWHELLGSKRGVLTELALARLHQLNPILQIWGITATIGNLDEACQVLIPYEKKNTIIRSRLKKKTKITSILPEKWTPYPGPDTSEAKWWIKSFRLSSIAGQLWFLPTPGVNRNFGTSLSSMLHRNWPDSWPSTMVPSTRIYETGSRTV